MCLACRKSLTICHTSAGRGRINRLRFHCRIQSGEGKPRYSRPFLQLSRWRASSVIPFESAVAVAIGAGIVRDGRVFFRRRAKDSFEPVVSLDCSIDCLAVRQAQQVISIIVECRRDNGVCHLMDESFGIDDTADGGIGAGQKMNVVEVNVAGRLAGFLPTAVIAVGWDNGCWRKYFFRIFGFYRPDFRNQRVAVKPSGRLTHDLAKHRTLLGSVRKCPPPRPEIIFARLKVFNSTQRKECKSPVVLRQVIGARNLVTENMIIFLVPLQSRRHV